MLCSLGIQAQNDTNDMEMLKDPYYLQLYLGINKSANENLPWTEFTKYPWSGGLFLGVGKEINKLWGWRAALRINRNKSRNVQSCESKEVWGWNNIGLFGDVTFDVSDVLRKTSNTDKLKRFNLKAFAGIGLAYTWNFDSVALSYSHPYSRASKLLPAVRAGVTATYRLSDKWRVGTELSHTFFEDHFNGVSYGTPLDARTNLKVGVTYLFAKKVRVKKPVLRKNKLKVCPLLPIVMPEPEDVKMRQIAGRAFLDFPVNETIIYPAYRNNPKELNRIKATIDSALFDKTIIITQITLHGYASPESPYSNNTRLAKGRTEALKKYLMQKYEFNSNLFKTDHTPEDWNNLRGFLVNLQGRKTKGDYWYDNKDYTETPEIPNSVKDYRDELLKVIDSDMNPDDKEESLKQVGRGEPYRWLLQYVYPGLRHTDYTIEYEVRPYQVKDGKRLIYTHPEALSLNEMYKVAMSYEEGSDSWLDAMLIAARQFPDDETANLNAACACIKTKRLNDARKYLAKAGRSEDSRYVANVIMAMEGDIKWEMKNGKLIVTEY